MGFITMDNHYLGESELNMFHFFPTTLSKSKWLEVELMMNVYLILMFPLGPKMVLGEVLPNGKHANSKQTWMEYEP